MMIKYCPNCSGKGYTKNLSKSECPVCHSELELSMVDESQLEGREELSFGSENNAHGGDNKFPMTEKDTDDIAFAPFRDVAVSDDEAVIPLDNSKEPFVDSKEVSTEGNCKSNRVTVRGRIHQYSSSGHEDGEYRRIFPVRVFDALVYHQRFEDVVHRMTIKEKNGSDRFGMEDADGIPVNVHGTIAGGIQLVDNAEVEVVGKYKEGILMAESIHVINNNRRTKVRFQRAVGAITCSIVMVLLFALICGVAMWAEGDFFDNMKTFFITWLITDVVLSLIYVVTSMTRMGILVRMMRNRGMGTPLLVILFISMFLSFLFMIVFGSWAVFGSVLTSLVYAIIPVVVIVLVIYFLLRSVF